MLGIVNTRRTYDGSVSATCHRCGSDNMLVLMVVIDGRAYCRGRECGDAWLPTTEAGWSKWRSLSIAGRKAVLAAAPPPPLSDMGQQLVRYAD